MRLVNLSNVTLMALAGALVACINHVNVQCGQDTDCNLSGGGVCTVAAGTADRWCAYPDTNCPTGYRFSTLDVGDGVSGSCVPEVDAGTPTPSVSCVALPYTCGANSNDNCCNSLEVSGGTYYRSYDAANDPNSGNTNFPATISNFRLDKYEVTVGRFRAFVAVTQGTQVSPPSIGAGAHPHIPGSGWEASWNASLTADTAAFVAALKGCRTSQTWTDSPGANENLPINCITWYEALAFCIWDGGYLPTEAEWNYAAAGGDQQRAYPWSSPPGSLMLDASHASFHCLSADPGCNGEKLTAVGTKPMGDGRWGQSDLAGNVQEWTLDRDDQYGSPCTDCANLVSSLNPYRVSRGGDYQSDGDVLRTGYRDIHVLNSPDARIANSGVRCARAP